MLSARRGIYIAPDCTARNEFEEQFWKKVETYDDSMERYSVCKYPMSEAELPAAMEAYGFGEITTGFAVIDLTPDHPKFSATLAHAIINANRYNDLDAIESVQHTIPEHVTAWKCEKMKRYMQEKYDTRIEQYNRGEKQWDTNVSITMVVKGIKKKE